MSPDSMLRSEPDELLRKASSELRHLLETGQDGRVETVLSAFPSLASDPHRAVELIVLEFQLRQELGQDPDPRQWYERFPNWSDLLRERLEHAPPAVQDKSQLETAALETASYVDTRQRKCVDFDLDAPVLGRHELLEEIGRGGMGVVFSARDLVLDRVVALKVIRSGNLASGEEVRRFYREARSAAQLRHPHIVPIYGMGLYEGQHCFTMTLFPRGSLSEHLEDYLQDVRAAVALTAKVARAVQAAHEHGLIHRDLKPANILLDEHSEPVVSDFGLAKQLDVTATQTVAEHPIGTPAYMAPEQARCEAATKASDIWSLGVILYELLTGRRPFTGSADVVKQRILQADPVSPRRLRRMLPRDLETIVLKCLAKEQDRRYGSAAELADELERWLADEPIRTRPESRWQYARRVFRHRVGTKGVLSLLAGMLLLSTGAAGLWGLFSYNSPEARHRRRQEQILVSIQRELAEGVSVTLVDHHGLPRWYRWRIPKDMLPLPDLKKSPLKLETIHGPTMLELLPDPQHVAYRFSAELQIQAMLEIMNIGLYFAAEELATPSGPEQCCGLFQIVVMKDQPVKAQLLLFGYCPQDANEDSYRYLVVPPLKSPPGISPNLPPASPGKQGEPPWRRLEVIVNPVTVRAFCDGVLMGEFDFADLRKRPVPLWREAHPDGFPLPTFSLRGGLGIFIHNGAANCRNVVVAPLPQ
jgi:serine/threonine-protein kinase